MSWRTLRSPFLVMLVLLPVLLAVGDIRAQVLTGNLHGKVEDPQGSVLSGVRVTVTKRDSSAVQMTNAQGEFSVLDLLPGNYPIKLELKGFLTIEYPTISIDLGRTTTIDITMSPTTESAIPPNLNSTIHVVGGLETVTFDTFYGQIVVNLPDDISAGDTISGTVIDEPQGRTEEERSRNQTELAGYVVEVVGRSTSSNRSRLSVNFQVTLGSGAKTALVTLQDKGGNRIGQAAIKVPVLPPTPISSPAGDQFLLPTLGQQGHPIQIVGPFDGSSANTALMWSRADGSAQGGVQNPAATSGSLPILAESPRKCVFEPLNEVAGPVELTIKDGGAETKGEYRNVGVALSAPKTQLLKGESTTVTIQVSGLQGLKQSIPLHLVKGGTAAMEGGDSQTTVIKPNEVNRDGTYKTARKITGQAAGGFSVTATVVEETRGGVLEKNR